MGTPTSPWEPGTSVYLLIQNSNPPGTFFNLGAVVSTGTGNTVIAVASADFNGDGNQDLVVSTTGGVFYFPGNGNATFGPAQTLSSCLADSCGSIAVGTFNTNNNQYLDVLVKEGNDAIMYLGNGNGSFSAGTVVRGCTGGITPGALAAGDFNNDGIPDLVCGNAVFHGNGDGTFTNPVTLSLENPYYALAAGFNTGGNLDAALFGPGTVEVYPGNGNGTFQLGLTTSVDSTANAGAGTADFNFDGNLDLAIYNAANPGTLDIFLGEGAGLFQTPALSLQACTATNTMGTSNAITVADVNGDGAPDVIISCNSGNTVSVFLSLPPSIFIQTSQGNSTAGENITLTAVVGSPAQGFLYVTGYTVQFYDGSTALGSASLSGGLATLAISSLAQGIHYLTATLIGPHGNTLATSGVITQVVSRSGCATNDTAKLDIVPGTIHHNRTTGLYSQAVRVTNTSSSRIEGPIEMALNNLPAGVTVVNRAGFTSGLCGFPNGAPLVDVGVCAGSGLPSGHSISFTVEFTDPSATTITYTPVAVEGYALR